MAAADRATRFEDAENSTREARKLAERDRDYRDNKQWTDAEVKVLQARKQPVVTYNRISRKIDYLLGLEKQSRKDPKAFPRNPDDEDAANAATDAIRYVCDASKWDDVRSAAWENLLVEGTCAILVGHRKVTKGKLRSTTALTPSTTFDPDLKHIPWDRFYYDPYSSKPNFSDAAFMGIVTWFDLDAAILRWTDAEEILTQTWEADKGGDTYDDKPKDKLWSDYKRRRVRVCEEYYLEKGVWTRCVYTKSGELEPAAPSPYLDEEGEPENPIKAMSLYVDRENNRYGAVRVLISPQDEVNKRRSKGLHLITMRQVRASRAISEDPEKIRKEMAKPDGVIMAEDGEFEVLPTNDMAAANFQLLQEAKNEIDLLGANAALAGKNEQDLSGRAILAQQQGGMVEVGQMFDRLRSVSLEVYRSIWNRIRQMWGEEKWIRVTDDERNLRFVGLNQQVTLAMLAKEVMEGDQKAIATAGKLVSPQLLQAALQGDQQAGAMLGSFVQQHQNEIVETRNAVNELDVDIVIDEGIDTPTVQAEQFDALIKMLPGLGPMGQSPQMMEMLIEASQLRNKSKLLDMLKQGPSPEQQQEEQQMKQLQMAGATAEVEKTQSETMLNQAKAQQTDPVAQLEIAQAEAAQKMGMEAEKHDHGMMIAERKQTMAEMLAARKAAQQPQAA